MEQSWRKWAGFLLSFFLIYIGSGTARTSFNMTNESTEVDQTPVTIYLDDDVHSMYVCPLRLQQSDHVSPLNNNERNQTNDAERYPMALGQSHEKDDNGAMKQNNPTTMDQICSFNPPIYRVDLSDTVGIYSHYAGFVTNYPHDDGASYEFYNSVDEKMPIWGMAAGGPSPGVQNSVWIGGDFDSKYTTAPCGTPDDCWIYPPIDGLYRGWRTQGYDIAPCNCPLDLQRAYYSANRGVMMFDLSYIPDNATINSVGFEAVLSKQFGSGEIINFSQIEADRSLGYENVSGTGFKWSYDDAADGNLYLLGWDVSPYATGNTATTSFNSTATTDVQAALDRNWFGLGLVSGAGETYYTSYYFGAFQGSGGAVPPILIIDYDYIVPDAPVLTNQPPYEITADGETTCPVLSWDIPNIEDGNNLHFQVEWSDTVPVYFEETFKDTTNIDFAQTSYYGMVTTSSHDVYDSGGTYIGTDPPNIHLDELELTYGASVYPYARNYNVGWAFNRPFISFIATDTWTGGDYAVEGLGDGMMGMNCMEWSSDDPISYPYTACATELGYAANITGIGGYISSGITESFWIALEYSNEPGTYYPEIEITNATNTFFVEFDPAIEDVIGVALFFTNSNDGYAYMADLQIFDTEIYDTTTTQTITSTVVQTCSNPSYYIEHARLSATDDIPAGTSIIYEMSNDDGANWFTVTPDITYNFPTSGNQLRWRAHLSTTSRSLTPRIYEIMIENRVDVYSSWDEFEAFEENALLGGTFQTMTAAGVPEYDGTTTYQVRFVPIGHPDGTYYWKVKAFAPSGTGDFGPQSEIWSYTQITDTTPPPDIGAILDVSRIDTTIVLLDWSLYSPEPNTHYHIYRSSDPSLVDTTVYDIIETLTYTDTSAGDDILFYRVRALDICNNESSN